MFTFNENYIISWMFTKTFSCINPRNIRLDLIIVKSSISYDYFRTEFIRKMSLSRESVYNLITYTIPIVIFVYIVFFFRCNPKDTNHKLIIPNEYKYISYIYGIYIK